MSVLSLARTDVVTVAPDAPVTEVATLMADEDIGSVVVTSGSEPVGIVTDRDLTLEVVADGSDPAQLAAEDVMTGDLFTVDADADIFEALQATADASVRRVPVVDDGQLVGIVSLDDFTVLMAGGMENVSEIVQAESPPY